ncbi:stage II sporulation protein M [Symmachiella dynata]|mgnify:CR=1 FL=1|uniref:stage II sporulation protein M n=1 Tax=Symmachiella dynata TaxID=2527995 RepID=UPI0030EF7169
MISKREYRRKRQADWTRFEALIHKVDSKGWKKLSGNDASQFSQLFREVCHDLSIVRTRDWGAGLTSYLNELVTKGHNIFYKAPPTRSHDFFAFLSRGFPRIFRRNIGFFITAAVMFFLPLGITWVVVQNRTELATRILPVQQLDQMEDMYAESSFEDFGSSRAAMGGFYIMNNVGIALRCFAMGVLLGTGTVYLLLTNGIVIGATIGYLVGKGHGENILSFVVSHGSFELTAIAVAGGAGLMLGEAIVHPGRRTRLDSLRTRGLEAVQIAGGAAVMLVVAAMIEAFWSPAPIADEIKYSAGGMLWLLVILYLTLAGRGEEVA